MASSSFYFDPISLSDIEQWISRIQAPSDEPAPFYPELHLIGTEAIEVLKRLKTAIEDAHLSFKIAEKARISPEEAVDGVLEAGVIFTLQRLDFIAKSIYGKDTLFVIKCINFLELLPADVLSSKIKLQCIEKLYIFMRCNKHVVIPEMLLIVKSTKELLSSPELSKEDLLYFSDLVRNLEVDSQTVLQSLATEVRVGSGYPMSKRLVDVLSSSTDLEDVLHNVLACIEMHTTSTMEVTLQCINYGTDLKHLLITRVLIEYVLDFVTKGHFNTEHCVAQELMHIWAFVKAVMEDDTFQHLDPEDPTKSAIYEKFKILSKHTGIIYEAYKKAVEHPDTTQLEQLHLRNQHLHNIIPDFIEKYFDGDLKKVNFILNGSKELSNPICVYKIVLKMCDLMTSFKQNSTYEKFALHCRVQNVLTMLRLDDTQPTLVEKFKRLQNSAPPCIAALIRLDDSCTGIKIGSLKDMSLFVRNNRVLCGSGLESNYFWIPVIDFELNVLYLKTSRNENHPKYLSPKLDARGKLSLTEVRYGWRVNAVDNHHVRLYSLIGNILLGSNLLNLRTIH